MYFPLSNLKLYLILVFVMFFYCSKSIKVIFSLLRMYTHKKTFSSQICIVLQQMEDITCPRVDTNFIFECSTRYLTSGRSERVRYQVKHSNRKFHIYKRACHILFIISTYQWQVFLTIFRRFPNTFRRFSKILQKLSKGQTIVSEHFPKISEHSRRLTRQIRLCFDYTATNLSSV